MSGVRRVLIVTRHYWPHTTDQTLRLRAWTRSLLRDSCEPLVLAPRWHPGWPRKLTCEEVPVELLDLQRGVRLLSKRYARTLTDRILPELGRVATIYCDAADDDALALLTHLPKHRRPPIIVRFDSPTLSGSPSFAASRQLQAMADVCRRADAVVVTHAIAHQQLVGAGIPDRIIHRWADDLVLRVDRSADGQSKARHVLGHTNHDMFVRGQDRLIICPGELTEAWKISSLINGLGPLIDQQRSLKLWLLGDGPCRSEYYDQLQYQGWHRIVAMPGCFTEMEHILQAADLWLFPANDLGWQWMIPSCVVNTLPCLVADGPVARQMLGAATEQLCFRSDDPASLQAAVRQWLRQPLSALRAPLAVAREHMAEQFSRRSPLSSLKQLLAFLVEAGDAKRV